MRNFPKNCVIFTYPKMGASGDFLPADLQNLAGLTGCTNQCKGFLAHRSDFQNLGFEIIAISSQTQEKMDAFKRELNLDFELISDSNFELEKELDLKTFCTTDGKKFYHRQALIFKDGAQIKRFDFIANPASSAQEILDFLAR